MKTLFLSLWFALVLGVVHVPAQSLPATEPESAACGEGGCPMCKMSDHRREAMKTEVAFKQGGEKQGDEKPSDAEQAVLDLERRWCDAEANHEVAFLEKVEADGFVFTDSTGKVTTKQDEIAEAKQGGEVLKFRLSDMKAHVYGNAAVVTGVTTFNVADAEGNPAGAAYRWTDVFVKQANGEWQVAASQATALNEEKPGAEKQGE